MNIIPKQPGTRAERRARLAMERKARESGDWGKWERLELPNGLPSKYRDGWTREVRSAYRNRLYSVLVRPAITDWGRHTPSGNYVDWSDRAAMEG